MSTRSSLPLRLAGCVATVLASTLAGAQSPHPHTNPAPAATTDASASRAPSSVNASALLPRIGFAYRSVFADFNRLSEIPVGSWRDANDTVTRIGGWRAYAAEAQAAQPSRPAESAHPPGHGARR